MATPVFEQRLIRFPRPSGRCVDLVGGEEAALQSDSADHDYAPITLQDCAVVRTIKRHLKSQGEGLENRIVDLRLGVRAGPGKTAGNENLP